MSHFILEGALPLARISSSSADCYSIVALGAVKGGEDAPMHKSNTTYENPTNIRILDVSRRWVIDPGIGYSPV